MHSDWLYILSSQSEWLKFIQQCFFKGRSGFRLFSPKCKKLCDAKLGSIFWNYFLIATIPPSCENFSLISLKEKNWQKMSLAERTKNEKQKLWNSQKQKDLFATNKRFLNVKTVFVIKLDTKLNI